MKVLILGDLHWGARSDNTTFLEAFSAYFDEVFFPLVEKIKPDMIVQVGDVFDKRSYLNVNTLYYVRTRFIEPLRATNIPSFIFPGNHDTYFKNTNRVNSLEEVFGYLPIATDRPQLPAGDVHLVTKPTTIASALLVPWISPDEATDAFEAIKTTDAPYCFGHFDFAGFNLGGGRQSEEGFDKELFKKFKLVISGHYHTRQASGNIFYCGVPYEKTWEDFGQWIGFHVLDTATGKITAYPNDLRMHYVIDWKEGEATVMPQTILQAADPENLNYLSGKIIRLVVHDNKHPVKLEKFISRISAVKPESMSVMHKTITVDGAKVLDELKDANPDDTVSTIKTYVDAMEGVPEKGQVLDILLKLHQKAVQMQAGSE